MSDDMSEAEEIEELIAAYRMEVGDWATSFEDACFNRMDRTEQALREKIRSIIAERDTLRNAARSHRE